MQVPLEKKHSRRSSTPGTSTARSNPIHQPLGIIQMNTPEKLRETLADVIAKHNEASGEYAVLNADYVSAAAKGEDAKADQLEVAMERTRRLIQRLELRRAA